MWWLATLCLVHWSLSLFYLVSSRNGIAIAIKLIYQNSIKIRVVSVYPSIRLCVYLSTKIQLLSSHKVWCKPMWEKKILHYPHLKVMLWYIFFIQRA